MDPNNAIDVCGWLVDSGQVTRPKFDQDESALAADTETEPPRAASRPGSKLTPAEFRHELNRLYAAYIAKGLMSDDLAAAAKCSRLTMAKWIGGYACPATPEAMESVLVAVSGGLT